MSDTIGIVAIVLAIAAIVYTFWQSKRPVTAANVLTAVQAVPSLATEVNAAAAIVVQSYEQARRKGQLESTPDLNEVMNKVRGWLPQWAKVDITNTQIIDAINSAILMASAVSAQIKADKVVAATPAITPAGAQSHSSELGRMP